MYLGPCADFVRVFLRERLQPQEGARERQQEFGCQATRGGRAHHASQGKVPTLVRSSRGRPDYCRVSD